MPWSWGLGMSVSTKDMVILGPREVRTGDIQEKIGMSPSHRCRTQSRLLGQPSSRASSRRAWGVYMGPGEEKRAM